MIVAGLRKPKQFNRTRIHLILFSPFYPSMLYAGIKGWQNPVSCEDVPAMDNIVAREGMEQRIVPTGMAVRDNEVKQRRNFSESIFREWLPADSVWLGMMEAQCGMEAVPVYVTRFGDKREPI